MSKLIFVVCKNDYPECVFYDIEKAKEYRDKLQGVVDQLRPATCNKVYVHIQEVPLVDDGPI